MPKLKIAVLYGGWGEEREVSIKSGKFVVENLDRRKYEVVPVLINAIEDIVDLKDKVNFVFIALHGKIGEGGWIQSLLDMIGLSYSSASPLPSHIGMDKIMFKKVLKSEGIKVIDDLVLDYVNKRMLKGDDNGYKQVLNRVCLRQTIRFIQDWWGYPIFVKPADSGSSFGISKVYKKDGLRSAVKEARKFSQQVIIEPAIEGQELTVGFIGKTVLPPILIIPQKGEFFDYESKYKPGGAKEICPAPISNRLKNGLKKLTLKIKQVVGVETYGRVDFIYDKNQDEIYPLEINTIPGMTATSLLPKAARAFGWSNSQLLDETIHISISSKTKKEDKRSLML